VEQNPANAGAPKLVCIMELDENVAALVVPFRGEVYAGSEGVREVCIQPRYPMGILKYLSKGLFARCPLRFSLTRLAS
jgi:hypothetical protein